MYSYYFDTLFAVPGTFMYCMQTVADLRNGSVLETLYVTWNLH